jgi:cytochrome c oxidase cbb3-type subunit 4
METLYPLVKQLWSVWLMLLFLGICAWALWPSRQKDMERYRRMPLDDEEPGNAH